jgi:hypothetical protein
MKKLVPILFIPFLFLNSCDLNQFITSSNEGNYFRSGYKIYYNGYTYSNGIARRDMNINFLSIGGRSNVNGYYAYAYIDSTFRYNINTGQQGNFLRTDTLYFSKKENGDIRFLSFGYYRIIPAWIDLFRFTENNNYYVQDFDQNINGQRWTLKITSRITNATISTDFAANLPVYKLEQRLQYSSPFPNTDLTFYWYWSKDYGLLAYDEVRDGLIFQLARKIDY